MKPEEKERKFITPERIKGLQESIMWLDDYKTPEDEHHFVGLNKNTELSIPTQYLNELGRINKRREELIKLLLK
jgi:hypothetical protein